MVKKLTRRPSRKDDLLDAAVGVIASGGITSLTIDAVARAAGVTKGGVQYHFASKDQLVRDLLDHLLTRFDTDVEHAAAARGGAGAWTRAYVTLLLQATTAEDHAAAAILASLPPGDPLAEPYARYALKWRQRAAVDGIDPGTAMVARLAADSLWLERSFGGASAGDVAMISDRLVRMIADAGR